MKDMHICCVWGEGVGESLDLSYSVPGCHLSSLAMMGPVTSSPIPSSVSQLLFLKLYSLTLESRGPRDLSYGET